MRYRAPWTYEKHAERLLAFGDAYTAWLDSKGDGEECGQKRSAVMNLAPEADAALRVVGAVPVMHPPPAFGGFVRHGLTNIVMGTEIEQNPHFVIDVINSGLGTLRLRAGEAARYWRNPLNWLVEIVHAILGIPAHLIGGILRVPRSKLAYQPLGLFSLSDLIGIASFAVTIIGVNEQTRWW